LNALSLEKLISQVGQYSSDRPDSLITLLMGIERVVKDWRVSTQ